MKRRNFIPVLAGAFYVTTAPAAEKRIPDLSGLTTHENQTTDKNFLTGKIALVGEIFAQCPMVCPRLRQIMKLSIKAIARKNPELAEKITPIMITVDPENDVPEQLKSFVSGTKIIGLTGNKADLKRARDSIGYNGDLKNPGDHSTTFRLILPDRSIKPIRTDELTKAQVAELKLVQDEDEQRRRRLAFQIENVADKVIQFIRQFSPDLNPDSPVPK